MKGKRLVGDEGLLKLVAVICNRNELNINYCKPCQIYWKIPEGHRYFKVLSKEEVRLEKPTHVFDTLCPSCQESRTERESRRLKAVRWETFKTLGMQEVQEDVSFKHQD
jgi:hypothetical protein